MSRRGSRSERGEREGIDDVAGGDVAANVVEEIVATEGSYVRALLSISTHFQGVCVRVSVCEGVLLTQVDRSFGGVLQDAQIRRASQSPGR